MNKAIQYTVGEIAEFVSGKVEGDADVLIFGIKSLEDAVPGTLSFLTDLRSKGKLIGTFASVVIVPEDFVLTEDCSCSLIRVPDCSLALNIVLERWSEPAKKVSGIDSTAYVSSSALVHPESYVGPLAYIGDGAVLASGARVYSGAYVGEGAVLGEQSVMHTGSRLLAGCRVGRNSIIHSNAVIGSDGFGYLASATGPKKIPHLGSVVLGDYVEIGANTCIDRGKVSDTCIGDYVKIDNLVQIAHNVSVGSYTIIAAQAGIAGSVQIGRGCMIGGQVGIRDHVYIADGTQIAAQSGVAHSVMVAGSGVMGSPGMEAGMYKKSAVVFKQLPELLKKISKLEAELMQIRKTRDEEKQKE